MPHQHTRPVTLTIIAALLAVALLATSALAMIGQPPASPVPTRFGPAPAAIQDAGPEAFGVLPFIRPQDGNGLDFNSRGRPPYTPSGPIIDFFRPSQQTRYLFDTTPILPDSALVIRPETSPATEQEARDIFARLGLPDPVRISRYGGTWDYEIFASNAAAQLHLDGRGHFSYTAPDLGDQCGAATVNPFHSFSTFAGTALPVPTATPFGAGTDLCISRGPAPDDATAIAVAQDFLGKVGFLPDASYTRSVMPPDARLPTLRTVRWTAHGPNGERLIGRDAQRDFAVTVGPNTNVTNAEGVTAMFGASSRYRLRSAADLAATLQASDAFVSLTLPVTDDDVPAIPFTGDTALTVHITGAAIGYSLAYTFDAQPYLIPVVIYTGTANTAESLAIGKKIGFTAYVDAVAHPIVLPVPVNLTVPLPTTPDLAALTSYTFTGGLPLTRADFDALATLFGLDNATATIDASPDPITSVGERIFAKYPGGASLSVNGSEGGEWQYNNGGKLDPGPNAPQTAPDVALAVVGQFIAAHHLNLSQLGAPTVSQTVVSPETYICYPLLLNNRPVVGVYGGTPECGLFALVDSEGQRFLLDAQPLLLSLQRNDTAGLQATPTVGNTAITGNLQPAYPVENSIVTAQNALDALATAPKPIPLDANFSAPENQLARLFIRDEPEDAGRHALDTTFNATRGQAAPNLFTANQVTLAYVSISVPTGKPGQYFIDLLPVWLISGRIDIGNRHRVAPFTYLYPILR